ncbi:MAG: GAF and ANTAR domain-containing protein [Actinomycetota bacterium]
MDEPTRETRINSAFVAVADTLTHDFDVVDLLHTLVEQCTTILDTDAGGLMLVDGNGRLQLMTSTSEAADFVEVMQLNADSGPCIDCFASGRAISVPDITESPDEWSAFRDAAVQAGFLAAHATPLKLRGQVIGTMNLFGTSRGALSERDAAVAQALSDVATIGILQERLVREGTIVAEQLHRALDTRILVEQAKGIISHTLSLTIEESFAVLRTYARNNNLTIRSVAEGVSNRTVTVEAIASARHLRIVD